MASRLVPDFPAVLVALEHIKELDKELSDEGVTFSPEASTHLSELSNAVTGLEAERRSAHEHLEVATIENSKLRHEINNRRDQMTHVIMTDVAAARASNAEEIEQQHKDLQNVSQMQESTVNQDDTVKSEIEAMSFDREKVKTKHQEVIADLNNVRTQRYALQSQLDNTRETIADLKASIALCEHNTLMLKQEVVLEKEAFVKRRVDLEKELEENEKTIKHQKEAILRSRKELQLLNESKRSDSDSLDELRLQTIELEGSIQRLQASKRQSEKILQVEKKKSTELTAEKEAREKELDEMINQFNKTLATLKQEIAATEKRIVNERATRIRLQEAYAKIYEIFKVHDKEEKEVRAEYDYVSELLEKSQTQLEERIATIVRYKKESNEMERQTDELKETDVIKKRVFERDQEELCGNIDVQKQHIQVLEEEKKQLQKTLKEQKKTQEDYDNKMTATIRATWNRVKELQTEEAELKQRRPMTPDEIKRHIEKLKTEYAQIESLCREQIKQLANEVEIARKKCDEKQKEVAVKEQILEDVEAKWKEETSRFEQLKKQEADFKRKKFDLDESIEALKNETVKLLETEDEKKAELVRSRAEHMDQLKKKVTEMKSVEMGIYESSVKLEQVQMENSRFHLRVRQMTEDMDNAKNDRERYRRETEQFQKDSEMLFRSLQEVWREELMLTQERHRVDEAMLVPMDALQTHLRTRKRQLGHVQALLHEQMLDFSRRLGDKITVEPQS